MHIRSLPLALLTSLTLTSVTAQTASPAPDLDYAILLGISEAIDDEAFADAAHDPRVRQAERREMQSTCAEHLPAVPTFTDADAQETPALARLVQLATAHRLRGESIAAAGYYAQVVQLSQNPIHLHFFAECARDNGDDMLAELLAERYTVARATGTASFHDTTPATGTKPIRLAGIVTDASNGNRLRYVEVRVLDPLRLVELTVTTDANGLFVVDGLTRGATLTVRATLDDYEISLEELKLDARTNAQTPIVGTRIYLQPNTSTAAIN